MELYLAPLDTHDSLEPSVPFNNPGTPTIFDIKEAEGNVSSLETDPSDNEEILLQYTPGKRLFAALLKPAINGEENGSRKLYDTLCSQLKVADMPDGDLVDVISGVKRCSHLLHKKHDGFTRLFLKVDWTSRSHNIVELYKDAVADLVTVQGYAVSMAINFLVQAFKNAAEFDEDDSHLISRFKNIHSLIHVILKVVPTSLKLLFQRCVTYFPFMNKSSKVLSWYVKNLMHVSEYAPSISQDLLDLTVDSLLKIDVRVSRDELIKLQAQEENEETQFEIDMLGDESEAKVPEKEEYHCKLDVLMQVLFEYIKEFCWDTGQNKLNMSTTKALFLRLEKSFSSFILGTYNCSHVQFLMFYVCSFDKTLSERFLELCWHHLLDPAVPVVLSQLSCSYMGGILTRAKYISFNQLRKWLSTFAEFIHSYIDTQDSDIYLVPTKHKIFYHLCQTVFYIVAFHHMDITSEPDGIVFLKKLNFERIVMARLNPLRFCLSTIADMFARVSRFHQIAFCYTVIERNRRIYLQNDTNSDHISKNEPHVHNYFPFDPYLLKKSSCYINEIYKHWDGLYGEIENKKHHEEDQLLDDIVKSFENNLDIFSNSKHFTDTDISMSPGFSIDVK